MATKPPNRIAQSFANKTIFMTGASGFMGRVLLEKILRTCPDIKKCYLLLRSKKGQSPQDRLKPLFDTPLFNLLKETNPEVLNKCVVMAGDSMEAKMGLSEEDLEIFKKEVNIVFHSAATIKFNDPVKYAVTLNTYGTQEALAVSETCQNLDLFVYLSTAYAYPNEEVLYEKPYSPPANPHEVIEVVLKHSTEECEKIYEDIMKNIPNTYTFSKAMAESLVHEKAATMPVLVLRPSIVLPVFHDPLPGWIPNFNGPLGLFVGAGKGIIRTMFINPKAYANLIPADVAINAILITSYKYLTDKSSNNQYTYNVCVPKEEICFNWEEVLQVGKDLIFKRVPFNRILWYPGGSFTEYKWWHIVRYYLLQLLPAFIIDLVLVILGQKPFLVNVQRRIWQAQTMIEYYTWKNWKFDTSKLTPLRSLLNETENEVYFVAKQTPKVLEDFFYDCIMYARRYGFKERDEDIPRAKMTMTIMFWVDKITKFLIIYGLIKYVFMPIFL